MTQSLEAPYPLSEWQFCASRDPRAVPYTQGKCDDFSTKSEGKRNRKDDRTWSMRQCQNCSDRSRKIYPGPIYLPRFSTPANTDVERGYEQPLVQVAFLLELAFEGHLLDRHPRNCRECPITSYSRPEQMNLPKQVATDGNTQCGHCRLFEIARLPYTDEQRI